MLQAQFVTIVLAAHPTIGGLESAMKDAAAAQVAYGQVAAKQALANHGYYPFALGRVADHRQATAEGLTHCSAIEGSDELFCARLSARIVDQSPVHLRVQAMPGYELLYAHWVRSDGRVGQLKPDAAGIFDLPSQDHGIAIGVTVRGPLGPETGLYVPLASTVRLWDPCGDDNTLEDVIGAINAIRADQGSSPLQFTEAPKAYERVRGRELKRRCGHSELGLSSLLAKHRLRLRYAAEVVAEDQNLGAICRGWMLSPSHRAALLDERRNQIAVVQRGDRLSALIWRRAR